MSFSRTVVHVLVFRGVRGVGRECVPGPLTLRMMERVWSFMNSTRHWVTPPREPVIYPSACHSLKSHCILHGSLTAPFLFLFFLWGDSEISRTGSAKDTGDLDEVDGGLSRVHFVRL